MLFPVSLELLNPHRTEDWQFGYTKLEMSGRTGEGRVVGGFAERVRDGVHRTQERPKATTKRSPFSSRLDTVKVRGQESGSALTSAGCSGKSH